MVLLLKFLLPCHFALKLVLCEFLCTINSNIVLQLYVSIVIYEPDVRDFFWFNILMQKCYLSNEDTANLKETYYLIIFIIVEETPW